MIEFKVLFLPIILIIGIYIIVSIWINNYFLKKPRYKIQDINYIYIDNIRINYIKKGTGDPILLVHGFINSILMFEKLINILSKHYTVFALDLIGFGFSDKHLNLTYTRKNMAELATKFMSSQGFNKFIVLGHSMGGEVTLNMAYYHPENISKLILIDSTGYKNILKLPSFIKNFNTISEILIKFSFRNYYFQKLCFKHAFYDKRKFDENLFNRIYSIVIRIPIKILYKFGLQGDNIPIKDKIKFIEIDTLIIWGKNDKLVPLKYGEKLNKYLKNSKLVVIDDCGHIPFVEKYDSFINILENYLSHH